ncbi:MAG: hypothetical protein ACLQVN_20405, partial [Bryobacteraceae bacterium]
MAPAIGTKGRAWTSARTRPRKACGVNAWVFEICSSVTPPSSDIPLSLATLDMEYKEAVHRLLALQRVS